jgi:apoptosis-inducing factor 2
MSTKTRIVVVGGGTAGASIIQSLSKQTDPSRHELILINPRPFDVWLLALLRAAVTEEGNLESLESGVLTPYGTRSRISSVHLSLRRTSDRLWTNGNGSLKVGTVTGIEAATGSGGVVHLASGEAVSYDVLVLAPGSIWEGPLDLPPTKAEVDAHLGEWRRRFKNAERVVIAGGGAVGIGS